MKRLSLMDFVLIVDDLEASFLRTFGVPAPKANSYSKSAVENNALIMPKYKRQNGGDKRYMKLYVPGKSIDEKHEQRIRELNDLDVQLYDFGVAINQGKARSHFPTPLPPASPTRRTIMRQSPKFTKDDDNATVALTTTKSRLTTFRWDFTSAALELRHGATKKGKRRCYV